MSVDPLAAIRLALQLGELGMSVWKRHKEANLESTDQLPTIEEIEALKQRASFDDLFNGTGE